MGFGFGFGFPDEQPLGGGGPPAGVSGELTEVFEAMTESLVGFWDATGALTETFEEMTEAMTGNVLLVSGVLTEAFEEMTESMTGDAALDMVVITRFAGTTANFPAVVQGTAVVECWSGGGGSTTATSSGGSGSYARINAYAWTSSESWTFAVGTGGATGGGTGGNTTFQTTVCVAAGAVGITGGLAASCTGDVTRGGVNGTAGAGTLSGGGAPGSATAAGAAPAPGGPEGGPGGTSVTGLISARVPGGGAASSAANQRSGADGLARLTYLQTSLGTLPNLVSYAVTRSTANTTSQALTMPSGNTGDTLVYIIATDGNPTITLTGATLVAGDVSGTALRCAMYSYVVNGSEPTSVGLSASEMVDVVVMRFRTLNTISGTAANGSGVNADPPSHDMGTSAATTWITAVALDSTATTGGTITARPTNYDESILVPTYDQAGGIALCVAWRDATAQTENPGTWTNTTIANVTITAGIRI